MMLEWIRGIKLWAIVGAIVTAMLGYLKFKADRAEARADKAEVELETTKAEAEVKEFQAINSEKANHIEEVKDENIDDDYSGTVSI